MVSTLATTFGALAQTCVGYFLLLTFLLVCQAQLVSIGHEHQLQPLRAGALGLLRQILMYCMPALIDKIRCNMCKEAFPLCTSAGVLLVMLSVSSEMPTGRAWFHLKCTLVVHGFI